MNIDPKIVVNACLIFSGIYIFLNQDSLTDGWPIWFPLMALAVALFMFNDKFISKGDEKERTHPQLGPQEPFMPPSGPEWEIGADGKPVRVNTPYPPRGRYQ